jgi:hypothetical protein
MKKCCHCCHVVTKALNPLRRKRLSDVDLSRKVQSGNTQSLELDEI